MSGAKSYKFNGSQIKLLVEFTQNSPSDRITGGVTKANPAVVTEALHGRVSGDVIKIDGVVGMTELNEGVYTIEVINTNTYRLVDVDSTGYGTYVSGGEVYTGQFSNMCELTNYNRQGGSSPEIDATSLCSTAAEFEVGLPDFGTTQLDYKFSLDSNVLGALEASQGDGSVTAVKLILPKNGGTRTQLGFVQQTSEQGGNGGIFTGSATIRNTGAPYDSVL